MYNAYLLARGDEVLDKRCFEAADDRTAKTRAEEFCRSNPDCVAVEIWDAGWLLYRHARSASKDAAPQAVG